MKTFFYLELCLEEQVTYMKLNWIAIFLTALFFVGISFLIQYDQYMRIGVWFQFADLHHETFAIASFAVAIGIFIGAILKK
jgi:hypothetical protein